MAEAERVPCPGCGLPKTRDALVCSTCMGTQNTSKQGHVEGRAVDLTIVQNPSWRPPHYPPACTRCNGFGYVPHRSEGWVTCDSCRATPGHAMSHTEWTETR